MILSLISIFIVLYILNKFNILRRKHQKLPPGPIGLPIVGYLPFLGRIPAITAANLSKRYGDIFSAYLGNQLVIFVNDVDTMREMAKMDNFLGRKQLDVANPVREKCGLGLLEGEGWAEWRRFTVRTFRDMGLGKVNHERLILNEVEDFGEFLLRHLDRPLYVQEAVEIALVNPLWILLTGEKFDLTDPEKKEIMRTITEAVSDQNLVGLVVFLPWLARLFPNISGWNKGLKCLDKPLNMGIEVIRKHQENHILGQESDYVDMALTKIHGSTNPDSAFYKEAGIKNLVFTILDLFFTGSDSISTTMGWAFLILAAHPAQQRKVQEEIDLVIGHHNLPSVSDRPSMTYTEAVMMEIQRLVPVSPLGVMHAALEDTEFRCFTIPKRTVILWNHYQVHFDPLYWGDPLVFRPERFIEGDGRTIRKNDHLIPFFVGRRSCPGESLASSTFFLFLTGILQKFHVSLEDPNFQMDYCPSSAFIVRPPEEGKVIFTLRET